MYNGLSNKTYEVPICQDKDELDIFLKVPNSCFKIVTDLDNAG